MRGPTCCGATTSPRPARPCASPTRCGSTGRERARAPLASRREARLPRLAVPSPPVENQPHGTESSVEVEIRGLEIYTHHGVSEAEREIGQRLEIDVTFDVPDCDAVLTDRVED